MGYISLGIVCVFVGAVAGRLIGIWEARAEATLDAANDHRHGNCKHNRDRAALILALDGLQAQIDDVLAEIDGEEDEDEGD